MSGISPNGIGAGSNIFFQPQVLAWSTAAGRITGGDLSQGGWNGWTLRQIITSAAFSKTGGSQTRVTFKAGAGEGFHIAAAYIGMAASAGDPYDFSTTPVQLLFGGATTWLIAASGEVVSDGAAFSVPAGQNIIVSTYCASAADTSLTKTTQAGYIRYQRNVNDPAQVDTSAYTLGGQALSLNVLVEVLS